MTIFLVLSIMTAIGRNNKATKRNDRLIIVSAYFSTAGTMLNTPKSIRTAATVAASVTAFGRMIQGSFKLWITFVFVRSE